TGDKNDEGATKLTLPMAYKASDLDPPKNLWVQGVKESAQMGDVKISISAGRKELSSVRFTVVWVDKPVVRWKETDNVSDKNAKRDNYQNYTIDKNFKLGFQDFQDHWGFGTEAGGTVHPNKFKFPGSDLHLDRDVEVSVFRGANLWRPPESFSATIPPGNDIKTRMLCDDPAADVYPPWKGTTIFGLDTPGLALKEGPDAIQPKGTIFRARANFKAFASVLAQGEAVRCSEISYYYMRISMQQTAAPDGNTWVRINDVAHDNEVGAASYPTPLTWDLQ
ncbi:hypothetical protein, partial [Mycobacterium sp.]|uniref:hypothetical protein n=1 Tax=Mycobacterium sp. TaxID=1785 RepID=UPI003BB01E51